MRMTRREAELAKRVALWQALFCTVAAFAIGWLVALAF
jgi:hypothetical protein